MATKKETAKKSNSVFPEGFNVLENTEPFDPIDNFIQAQKEYYDNKDENGEEEQSSFNDADDETLTTDGDTANNGKKHQRASSSKVKASAGPHKTVSIDFHTANVLSAFLCLTKVSSPMTRGALVAKAILKYMKSTDAQAYKKACEVADMLQ